MDDGVGNGWDCARLRVSLMDSTAPRTVAWSPRRGVGLGSRTPHAQGGGRKGTRAPLSLLSLALFNPHIARQQPLSPQGGFIRVGADEDERRQAFDAELKKRKEEKVMRFLSRCARLRKEKAHRCTPPLFPLFSYLARDVRVGVHVQLDDTHGFPQFARHLLELLGH